MNDQESSAKVANFSSFAHLVPTAQTNEDRERSQEPKVTGFTSFLKLVQNRKNSVTNTDDDGLSSSGESSFTAASGDSNENLPSTPYVCRRRSTVEGYRSRSKRRKRHRSREARRRRSRSNGDGESTVRSDKEDVEYRHRGSKSRKRKKKGKKKKHKTSTRKRVPKKLRSMTIASYGDKFAISTTPATPFMLAQAPLYSAALQRKPKERQDALRYFHRDALAPTGSTRKVKARIGAQSLSCQVSFIPLSFAKEELAVDDPHDLSNITEKLKELNFKVRTSPASLQPSNWLQMIQLKHMHWVLNSSGKVSLSLPFRDHVADLVSICELALRAHPKHEELLLFSLEARGTLEAEDSDHWQTMWEEALSENPTSAVLWERYIDISLSTFERFNEPELRELLARALLLKRHVSLEAANQQHASGMVIVSEGSLLHRASDSSKAEDQFVALATRYLCLEQASGYTELVVGLMQILLEINHVANVFRKDGTSPIRIQTHLAAFWDSETERIGEVELECLGGKGESQSDNVSARGLVQPGTLGSPPNGNKSQWTSKRCEAFSGPFASIVKKFSHRMADFKSLRFMPQLLPNRSNEWSSNGEPQSTPHGSLFDLESDHRESDLGSDVEMQYSTVHGYRIPVSKNTSVREANVYESILDQVRELAKVLYPSRSERIELRMKRNAHAKALRTTAMLFDETTDSVLRKLHQEVELSSKRLLPIKLCVSPNEAMEVPETCILLPDVQALAVPLTCTNSVLNALFSCLEVLGLSFPERQVARSLNRVEPFVEPVLFTMGSQRELVSCWDDWDVVDFFTQRFQVLRVPMMLSENRAKLTLIENFLRTFLGSSEVLKGYVEGSTVSGHFMIALVFIRFEVEILKFTRRKVANGFEVTSALAQQSLEMSHALQDIAKQLVQRFSLSEPKSQLLLWWEYAHLEQEIQELKDICNSKKSSKTRENNKLARICNKVLKSANQNFHHREWFVFQYALSFLKKGNRKGASELLCLFCNDGQTETSTNVTGLQLVVMQHRLLLGVKESLASVQNLHRHQSSSLLPEDASWSGALSFLFTFVFHSPQEASMMLKQLEVEWTSHLSEQWNSAIAASLVRFRESCALVVLLAMAHDQEVGMQAILRECCELWNKDAYGRSASLLVLQLHVVRRTPRVETLKSVFDASNRDTVHAKVLGTTIPWKPDPRLPALRFTWRSLESGETSMFWACAIASELSRAYKTHREGIALPEKKVLRILFGIDTPPPPSVVCGEHFDSNGMLFKCLARVRSILVRITKRREVESVVKNAPWVWNMFIRLELLLKRPEQCKAVLLSAIRCCSLSKDFWLDALQVTRPYLDSRECQHLISLAHRKGVFFRHELRT